MTEEQRNQFRKAQKAIREMKDLVRELAPTFLAITPTSKKADEWRDKFISLQLALGDVAELVEGEENFQILMGLPERD